MISDGETMGLVTHPLQQQQRRAVRFEDYGVSRVSGKHQLFLLGEANGHQVGLPQTRKRVVGRRDLPFTAIDDHQVRKRPPVLQQAPIAPSYDFPHSRKVVLETRFRCLRRSVMTDDPSQRLLP